MVFLVTYKCISQFSGNGVTQNSYFKVVNEHSQPNGTVNNEKLNSNYNIKVVIGPKNVPNLLKRPTNVCSPPSLVIQGDNNNNRGKIAIVPIARNKFTDVKDTNIVPAKVGLCTIIKKFK